MGRHRLLVPGALLALSCASGGDASADDYVDAVVDAVVASDSGYSEAQARCLGEAIVDVVGVDALHDADASPDDVAEGGSIEALGVDVGPDAVPELQAAVRACDLTGEFAEVFASGLASELSSESRDCIAGEAGQAAIADAIAASYLTDVDGQGGLVAVAEGTLVACPGALLDLFVDAAEAQGPPLTAEGTACVAGVLSADPNAAAAALAAGMTGEVDGAYVESVRAACPGATG